MIWLAFPRGGHLDARTTQQIFDHLPPRTFATSARLLTWLHRWLTARGISYRIAYQPASHFWLLQTLLAAILLALAMLTGWGTPRFARPGTRRAPTKHR